MPNVSLQDTLGNQQFVNLPLGKQLEVLRGNNEAFAKLSPKDQGTILFKAKQSFLPDYTPKTPEDQGFFTTLGHDIGSLFTTNPIDSMTGSFNAGAEELKKAEDPKLSYMERFGHGLAGAIPMSGPLAAQAGEELGNRQYGQGSAHALEALFPFLVHTAPEGVMEPVKAVAKGAAKGTYEGLFNTPISGPLYGGVGGYALGKLAGGALGGEVGAGVGAALPLVRKAIAGGKEGFQAYKERNISPGLRGSAEGSFEPNPNIKKGYSQSTSSGPTKLKGSVGDVKLPKLRGDLELPAEDTSFKRNPNIARKYARSSSSGPVGLKGKIGKVARPTLRDDLPSRSELKVESPFDTSKIEVKNPEVKSSVSSEEPLESSRTPQRRDFDRNVPPGTPLQEHEIEAAQSMYRKAKETRLARHLIATNADLDNIKPTNEIRKALGKEAGLPYKPSERTLKGAIDKARVLKKGKPL